MEDVLDLYHEPYDPRRPVLCFDESPHQLLADVYPTTSPKPRKPLHYDFEYARKGIVNMFVVSEPLTGWQHIEVTKRVQKKIMLVV